MSKVACGGQWRSLYDAIGKTYGVPSVAHARTVVREALVEARRVLTSYDEHIRNAERRHSAASCFCQRERRKFRRRVASLEEALSLLEAVR